jgi:Aminoglycoside-2''-adenylyltransferase
MQGDQVSKQLRLAADIHQLLSDACVEHWLAGGWGIDFALGKITRRHADIDFAIWKDDWPRVADLLLKNGFDRQKNEFPEETARLLNVECETEFYLLQRTSDGEIIIGGRWADWPFADGSFGKTIGFIDGVKCPVMSLQGQLDSKEQWARQKHSSPPREKDLADIALLRTRLLGT